MDFQRPANIAQVLSLIPGAYCAYAAYITLRTFPAQSVPPPGLVVTGGASGTLVLVAFGAFVALLVIGLIFAGLATTRPKPKVTPENIEGLIRGWLDAFGMSVRKEIHQDVAYFYVLVTMPRDIIVNVLRLKDFNRYVTMISRFALSPDHAEQLAGIETVKQVRLMVDLARDFLHAGIMFHIDFSARPQTVQVERKLPITDALTEAVFIESLLQVQTACEIAKELIVLRLLQEQ
jgi:hypothetical protein